jgi:hypothetical protein
MNIWNYDFSSKMFAVCVGHSPNNANKTLLGGGGEGGVELLSFTNGILMITSDGNRQVFNSLFSLNFVSILTN